MAFRYNYAVVCRIPDSFKEKGQRITANQTIDVEKAREEYRNFLDTLRKCEVNIVELQEDESYPDCAFVEDCAVVIGGTALICRPGLASRQGEVRVYFCISLNIYRVPCI